MIQRPDRPPRRPEEGAFSLQEKIDVCRGLFAALVVVAHSTEIARGMHPGAEAALTGWGRDVLLGVFGTGSYYVMGFFVLSGYCIHLSVARSMREGRFPAGRYFVARLTRILPLYYLGLLAALAVEWAIAGARPRQWPNGLDAGTFVAQVFVIQNLTETFGSFASSWSITNEVFYYLAYGLLACLLVGRQTARPAWVGMGLCVAVAVVTQVLYVTVARNPYVYSMGMLFGLGILWFMGALVAVHGDEWVRRPSVRMAARLWPVVLAVAFVWKVCDLTPHGIYLISGLAFTLMILHFLSTSPARTPASAGPVRKGLVTALGLSSYPMYLFHGPLLMLLGSWLMRSGWVADWRVAWVVLTAAGLVSGVALGWLLERPVMSWRASLLRRRKEADPLGVPTRQAAAFGPVVAAAGAGVRS